MRQNASRKKVPELARRVGSSWRIWLPAALLALGLSVATQVLQHYLWMDHLPVFWSRVAQGMVQDVILVIPVILYLLWRRRRAAPGLTANVP